MKAGTLGGRFTTLEGILDQVYEELSEKVFVDAQADDGAFEKFLAKLKEVSKTSYLPRSHSSTVMLDSPKLVIL